MNIENYKYIKINPNKRKKSQVCLYGNISSSKKKMFQIQFQTLPFVTGSDMFSDPQMISDPQFFAGITLILLLGIRLMLSLISSSSSRSNITVFIIIRLCSNVKMF